jgi:hypothetical protein
MTCFTILSPQLADALFAIFQKRSPPFPSYLQNETLLEFNLQVPLQHLAFTPLHGLGAQSQTSPNGAIRPLFSDALMHCKVGLLEVGNDVTTLVGLADMVDDVGAFVGLPVTGDVVALEGLPVGDRVGALEGLPVGDEVVVALEGLPVGALEEITVGDEVGPVIVGLDVVGLGVGAAEFSMQRDTPYLLV